MYACMHACMPTSETSNSIVFRNPSCCCCSGCSAATTCCCMPSSLCLRGDTKAAAACTAAALKNSDAETAGSPKPVQLLICMHTHEQLACSLRNRRKTNQPKLPFAAPNSSHTQNQNTACNTKVHMIHLKGAQVYVHLKWFRCTYTSTRVQLHVHLKRFGCTYT